MTFEGEASTLGPPRYISCWSHDILTISFQITSSDFLGAILLRFCSTYFVLAKTNSIKNRQLGLCPIALIILFYRIIRAYLSYWLFQVKTVHIIPTLGYESSILFINISLVKEGRNTNTPKNGSV